MELRTEDSTNTRSLETQCSIIFMSLASLNLVVKLDNRQFKYRQYPCKKFLHLLPNFGHISIFDGSGTQKSDFFRYPFPPLMAPHNTYSRIYYLKTEHNINLERKKKPGEPINKGTQSLCSQGLVHSINQKHYIQGRTF